MVLSASITRDSSPPDATRASGRSSCPTLSDTRNSTASAPSGPISRSGSERGVEVAVGHAEVGQHLVDRACRAARPPCVRARGERGRARPRASPRRAARAPRAPAGRDPRSPPGRARARATRPVSTTSASVGAVLLRQPEEQVAAAAHLVEPRRIEVDRRLVLAELARQRLELVVRGVVQLLEPRERRDRCAGCVASSRSHAAELARAAVSSSPSMAPAMPVGELAQLFGVLEPARLVLQPGRPRPRPAARPRSPARRAAGSRRASRRRRAGGAGRRSRVAPRRARRSALAHALAPARWRRRTRRGCGAARRRRAASAPRAGRAGSRGAGRSRRASWRSPSCRSPRRARGRPRRSRA